MQGLESINNELERLLRSNDNRSLSGIFKAIRRRPAVSEVGDYILLKYIIQYAYSRTPQTQWNRRQMLRAVRASGFYKDEDRKQAYIPDDIAIYLETI